MEDKKSLKDVEWGSKEFAEILRTEREKQALEDAKKEHYEAVRTIKGY